MDADDVKNKIFDVSPPESAQKPSELNLQSRQMMVSDPTEPSNATVPTEKKENVVAVEAPQNVVVDPMLVQPKPVVSEEAVIQTPEPETTATAPIEAPTEQITAPEPPILTTEPEQVSVVAEQNPVEIVEEPVDIAESAAVSEPSTEQPIVATEQPAKSEEIEDKETLVSPAFNSVDGLPDNSINEANKIKDDMQEPKIYDTTAYHVPIKETVHGHGGVKSAIIFGVLFAVLLVGGIVYILFIIGS